jgi:Arc/MetJ-type ribon-helix-helix transcriptional regulator
MHRILAHTHPFYEAYTQRMTTPVPTRFSDEEIEVIDRLVERGVGLNRSEVIRLAVERLADAIRRAETGARIADSYRERPQDADEDALAMASAIALTEAEPW